MKRHFFILLAFFAGAFAARGADQANTVEGRLRDVLRSTALELRTVTADRDNLQAQVTDLQSQTDQLTKQVAALTKQSAADKDADTRTITVLKTQVTDQEDSIARLQQSLDQWKDADRKATAIANETEGKRAKLAEMAIHLQRIVDDQKRKNDEMYKIGMEILDRYEKFGLGQALLAKEPFVGVSRARFETLVQDEEDKLTDQRVTEQKPKQ